MPSDEREFAFSSRVPPKALKIKAPYKLKIDTLCHEGIVSQKVVRFSHLTFRKQNMPQTIQNKDQFGLHWQALRVKDGTMSTLQGSWHSPIKDKCVK